MEYRGLTAKAGTRTATTVIFRGSQGTTVPSGTKITDKDRTKIFVTDASVVLNQDGEASVSASCENVGAIPLANEELTVLIEPIFGVGSVSNSNVIIGTDDETDQEIHRRLEDSTGASGYGYLDAIDSELSNLIGVKTATSYVGEDSDKGLAAGEMCAVVSGGDDKEIAQTLFEKNMFLLKTKGNTEVTITSEYLKREYKIQFERPTQVDDFKATVTIESADTLPSDIDDLLYKAAVYFCETLKPSDAFFKTKFASYLDDQNYCNILKVSTKFSDEEKEKYDIPWNKTLALSRENFTVEKE